MAARTINLFRGMSCIIGNPAESYVDTFGSEEGLIDFINIGK